MPVKMKGSNIVLSITKYTQLYYITKYAKLR